MFRQLNQLCVRTRKFWNNPQVNMSAPARKKCNKNGLQQHFNRYLEAKRDSFGTKYGLCICEFIKFDGISSDIYRGMDTLAIPQNIRSVTLKKYFVGVYL